MNTHIFVGHGPAPIRVSKANVPSKVRVASRQKELVLEGLMPSISAGEFYERSVLCRIKKRGPRLPYTSKKVWTNEWRPDTATFPRIIRFLSLYRAFFPPLSVYLSVRVCVFCYIFFALRRNLYAFSSWKGKDYVFFCFRLRVSSPAAI